MASGLPAKTCSLEQGLFARATPVCCRLGLWPQAVQQTRQPWLPLPRRVPWPVGGQSAVRIGTQTLCLFVLKSKLRPSKPTLQSALVEPPRPQQISNAIRSPGAGREFAGELLRHSSGMGKAGERHCAVSPLAPWMDQSCLLRLEAGRFALASRTGQRESSGFPRAGAGGPGTVECWGISTMVEGGA